MFNQSRFIRVLLLLLVLQFAISSNTQAQRSRNNDKNYIGLDISPALLNTGFYRIIYGRSIGSINVRGGLGGFYAVDNEPIDSTSSFQTNSLDYSVSVGAERVMGKRDDFFAVGADVRLNWSQEKIRANSANLNIATSGLDYKIGLAPLIGFVMKLGNNVGIRIEANSFIGVGKKIQESESLMATASNTSQSMEFALIDQIGIIVLYSF
jgi:hypothetical protein